MVSLVHVSLRKGMLTVADSALPMKRIQSLLLDLIMDDGPSSSSNKAGPSSSTSSKGGPSIAQFCDLLHLSTNWAVQTMAYRLLRQAIHRDTLALVLEVEASIAAPGEGKMAAESQKIQLPEKLMEITKAGISMDWTEPTTHEVRTQATCS